MNINPLRRSPLRKKAKEHKESAPWRRKKVRLDGREMVELRQNVFARAAGQCENEFQGKRCKTPITWMMFDMHHMQSRGRGGSDTMDNCLAVCWSCHRLHHMGKLRIQPHIDWIAI